MELVDIRQAIIEDVANREFTNKGIAPLFQAPSTAKILIIGQAPGLKTQEKGRLFDDASFVNGWAWIVRHFMNRVILLFFLWISIIQEKGSLGICRLVRILRPNGIHLFWTNYQSLS